MLILSNDDVEKLLLIEECIAVLQDAYRDVAAKRALSRPRSDIYMPASMPDANYIFKTMEGAFPSGGVVALRLNSDVIRWTPYAGNIRKDKQPAANGKWVGLVWLFSSATGEPLAIMPDGVLQRTRVGASSALAAKYMARDDAEVYGLLGAGWQAGAQLMAMAAVRHLHEVRVFSPSRERREAFAAEWSTRLRLNVRAVETPAEAVAGAQIVGAATNALGPVLDPECLEPGMFLTCVKRGELSGALERCHRVVVHTRMGSPQNYLVGLGERMVSSHDPLELIVKLRAGMPVEESDIRRTASSPANIATEPELAELVAGHVKGRDGPHEITAFVNNIGLGIQFAALGSLVYRRAVEARVGREIPTDWFTQDVHP
jgi:ornithine cyclodeaminase/alanine dehydrogenase-like protein (mu-crystallin family)